jgi:hypothetical protein
MCVRFGGLLTGPSPVDRARTDSKHHLLTDAAGVPLAISLTGGNRNDVTRLLSLIDGIEPVAASVDGRGNAPTGCSLTAAMTTISTVASCGPAA